MKKLPDVAGIVGDASHSFKQDRDPLQRPEICWESMSQSAAKQFLFNLLALLWRGTMTAAWLLRR